MSRLFSITFSTRARQSLTSWTTDPDSILSPFPTMMTSSEPVLVLWVTFAVPLMTMMSRSNTPGEILIISFF